MPKPLVIVESPAKAKTISKFLGKDWMVEASIGHVRDLPSNASEIPAAVKAESWARLGVNVDREYARLQAEGVPITTPIETEPWGERYFQVSDPNGVTIQLVQWVTAPDQ